MKNNPHASLSTEELVQRFLEITSDQFSVRENNESTKYNKLYDKLNLIIEELKRRPGDGRTALVPLLSNPNIQIRFMAACNTLAVVPEQARRTLEYIRSSDCGPYKLDAGFMIEYLDKGKFIPD